MCVCGGGVRLCLCVHVCMYDPMLCCLRQLVTSIDLVANAIDFGNAKSHRSSNGRVQAWRWQDVNAQIVEEMASKISEFRRHAFPNHDFKLLSTYIAEQDSTISGT